MTNHDFTTLAYTKSPKTSRRTTFQDELHAAISARASKSKIDHLFSDDFNEDEDGVRTFCCRKFGKNVWKSDSRRTEKLTLDFSNQFLKSRRKKDGAFQGGKSKARINDFEISDDEDKHGRMKRVSFLKTQRMDSPWESEDEPPHSSVDQHNDYNNSFSSSQHSTTASEDATPFMNSDGDSTEQEKRESASKSLSYQTSDDTLLDTPLPLPSDDSVAEPPGPEEKSNSGLEESSQTAHLSAADLKLTSTADSATGREPPRPKPRQRTLGLSFHATEKIPEDAESQDVSRPQTSSASIPLSTDTSSNVTWAEGDRRSVSCNLSKTSSSKSEQSRVSKSTADSGSREGFNSDDSKEQERKYSSSFEEFNPDSGELSDQLSKDHEKSFDSRTSRSQSKTPERSQSVCSRKVESKYLGSLKLLDRKVSLQESQPQAADSLRAAVYQEWLQKKMEKSRESMQLKKKEEMLKEKKKREEEAKKEDAAASYQAWKERKAGSLKAKAKEKQDMSRKQLRATEEKEEKRQSAKEVFEKWKREHDGLLKEKYREQREAESKLQLKKQEKEEERKRDCRSAFSNWCEKKNNVLHEKVTKEREAEKNKGEEERYMKEEKEATALETYENWLVRKDLEHKRQREERRIQAILRDSPPPPWSPPNKTVPFGK